MFTYPWGDFHSLNLGWFLQQFKDWTEKIQEYLDNGGGTSENLANVIAPVFNAENSYLTGDYVLYNDELYKANQAVNPGTWNPDAWTRCLVTEEMGSGSGGVDTVARLMIAGQYSNTYNYQKYAICRYNDKLWMCNTNLPAGGEEWEQSHWDEITVGAGLTGLRRSVDTLSQAISQETETREDADTALQSALNAITPLASSPINGSSKGITSGAVYNEGHYKQGDTLNYSGLIIGRTGTGRNSIYIVLHLPKMIDVAKENITVAYASGSTPVLYPTSSELLNIITDAGYQINSILDQNATITVNDVAGDRIGLLLPFVTTLTGINNNTTPRTALADISLVFNFN